MTVKRFRTKPVEIEAMQFTGDNFDELDAWTEGNFTGEGLRAAHYDGGFRGLVFDKLHDTWIGVAPGQWIVRGAKQEFYPCDNETFFWKYEEVANTVTFGDYTYSVPTSPIDLGDSV